MLNVHMKNFLYAYTVFFKCLYYHQTQNPFEPCTMMLTFEDIAGHPKRTYFAK